MTSGQPFGGNEDLRSDLYGALMPYSYPFGTNIYAHWLCNAIGMMEIAHGDLVTISDSRNLPRFR